MYVCVYMLTLSYFPKSNNCFNLLNISATNSKLILDVMDVLKVVLSQLLVYTSNKHERNLGITSKEVPSGVSIDSNNAEAPNRR